MHALPLLAQMMVHVEPVFTSAGAISVLYVCSAQCLHAPPTSCMRDQHTWHHHGFPLWPCSGLNLAKPACLALPKPSSCHAAWRCPSYPLPFSLCLSLFRSLSPCVSLSVYHSPLPISPSVSLSVSLCRFLSPSSLSLLSIILPRTLCGVATAGLAVRV